MTVEECNRAAYARLPVVCRGIVYKRIYSISKVFATEEAVNRGGERTYYLIKMEDMSGRSYTNAEPSSISLCTEKRE